jgi:preprotein translocase subunit SecE
VFAKIRDFFKGVIGEMKRVSWTSRKELISATGAVMLLSTLMTLVIWGLDVVFKTLLSLLLKAFV